MRDIRDIAFIEGVAYDEKKIRNLLLENEKICSQNAELLKANDTLAHNNGILEEQTKMLLDGVDELKKDNTLLRERIKTLESEVA